MRGVSPGKADRPGTQCRAKVPAGHLFAKMQRYGETWQDRKAGMPAQSNGSDWQAVWMADPIPAHAYVWTLRSKLDSSAMDACHALRLLGIDSMLPASMQHAR